MGGGAPSNTTQTVIQQQQLPDWYQSYLQNLIGRGQGEAAGEAPIYSGQRNAGLTDLQNQGIQYINDMQGGITPYFNQANDYINQAGHGSALNAGLGSFGQAGQYGAEAAGQNISGAVNPYLQQGTQQNVVGLASPYIQQGTQGTGMAAAQPYLNAASQSLPQATQNNLSPYLGGALNALSDQASYDLKNKYLPAVNDSFIKAGQFGSTRNQDITAQTIHDLSNTVQQNQAGLINQAYGQAGQLAQQNLGLQGQLAQTAGGLGSQQQQANLQAGQILGGLGGTQGSLALQGAGIAGNAANQQGQLQLGAGQLANQTGANQGQLAAADYSRMLAAGQASQSLGQAGQQAGFNQANAMFSAGAQQQQGQQTNLNTAYQDWLNQTFYPQNQTSWLSNIVRGLPSQPAGYGQSTTTSNPTNTGAQVGGLLTSGLALSGTTGAGGSGGTGGYYRRGGKVARGKVSKGLGQFKVA